MKNCFKDWSQSSFLDEISMGDFSWFSHSCHKLLLILKPLVLLSTWFLCSSESLSLGKLFEHNLWSSDLDLHFMLQWPWHTSMHLRLFLSSNEADLRSIRMSGLICQFFENLCFEKKNKRRQKIMKSFPTCKKLIKFPFSQAPHWAHSNSNIQEIIVLYSFWVDFATQVTRGL